jgi:hypothetical protein
MLDGIARRRCARQRCDRRGGSRITRLEVKIIIDVNTFIAFGMASQRPRQGCSKANGRQFGDSRFSLVLSCCFVLFCSIFPFYNSMRIHKRLGAFFTSNNSLEKRLGPLLTGFFCELRRARVSSLTSILDPGF